jgi:hypothetical protein
VQKTPRNIFEFVQTLSYKWENEVKNIPRCLEFQQNVEDTSQLQPPIQNKARSELEG